jgi:hypothetical protein
MALQGVKYKIAWALLDSKRNNYNNKLLKIIMNDHAMISKEDFSRLSIRTTDIRTLIATRLLNAEASIVHDRHRRSMYDGTK